jgi:hypothetical protein
LVDFGNDVYLILLENNEDLNADWRNFHQSQRFLELCLFLPKSSFQYFGHDLLHSAQTKIAGLNGHFFHSFEI